MSDFFIEHYVSKSRKLHKCNICSKIIEKGKGYLNRKGKYDGEMYNDYICNNCTPLFEQFCSLNKCEEFDYWNIEDDINEKVCGECTESKYCIKSKLYCKKAKEEYLNYKEEK